MEDLVKLEQERQKIQAEILTAQDNIAKAKTELRTSGKYADDSWFQEQQHIVRTRTVDLHAINRLIKATKAHANRSSYQNAFIEATKTTVDTETVKRIHSKTMEMLKSIKQ